MASSHKFSLRSSPALTLTARTMKVSTKPTPMQPAARIIYSFIIVESIIDYVLLQDKSEATESAKNPPLYSIPNPRIRKGDRGGEVDDVSERSDQLAGEPKG